MCVKIYSQIYYLPDSHSLHARLLLSHSSPLNLQPFVVVIVIVFIVQCVNIIITIVAALHWADKCVRKHAASTNTRTQKHFSN